MYIFFEVPKNQEKKDKKKTWTHQFITSHERRLCESQISLLVLRRFDGISSTKLQNHQQIHPPIARLYFLSKRRWFCSWFHFQNKTNCVTFIQYWHSRYTIYIRHIFTTYIVFVKVCGNVLFCFGNVFVRYILCKQSFHPGSWRLCQDLAWKVGWRRQGAGRRGLQKQLTICYFVWESIFRNICFGNFLFGKRLEAPEVFSEFRHRQATSELASHLASIGFSIVSFVGFVINRLYRLYPVNLSYLSWPGILQAPPRNCQVGGRFR